MATATLLYAAVPVINQNTSSRGCSCSSAKVQTTPELLKKMSSVLQQKMEGTPAVTQQSSWSRRKERSTTKTRRQLHYPAQEEEDRSQEEAQEAEHWLGVGRDLRCLADSLAGVPGVAQGEAGAGSLVDLSSASSLVYSILVLAIIRRLSRAAGLDFKHLF